LPGSPSAEALTKLEHEDVKLDGSFRADIPPEWHLSMLLALVHAASAEAGRISLDPPFGLAG